MNVCKVKSLKIEHMEQLDGKYSMLILRLLAIAFMYFLFSQCLFGARYLPVLGITGLLSGMCKEHTIYIIKNYVKILA